MKQKEIEILDKAVKEKKIMTISDLKRLFTKVFPEKDEKYFNFYFMELNRNNVLYRYDTNKAKIVNGRRKFTFSNILDNETKRAFSKIEPSIKIATWELSDVSNFMSLQMTKNLKFVETYSYAREIVINILISEGHKAVLEEDFTTFSKYFNEGEIYVIRKLNDESPIKKSCNFSGSGPTNISCPKIEKLIVDMITDDIFDRLLSGERYNIICGLLKDYEINLSTIRRYSTKKHKWPVVLNAIQSTGFNVETGEFQ